jgi:hypothetical protein
MESVQSNTRNIVATVVYFFLSTVITWYFIACAESLYHFDQGKMLLSCAIAGAKWAIQIGAAFFLLKEKRWPFIAKLGFVCFVGSCVLIPFCIDPIRNLMPERGFLYSLMASVAVMLVLYYSSVKAAGISMGWYFLWLVCLVTAISLQLTVVFHMVG